jgi:hypothetical protein
MAFERFVLPSKNMQVGVRFGVGGSLAVEDLVVHGEFASAEVNDDFPHFLESLHRQRARECKGEESEEGEEGDDESGALHVESVEVERRERKVLSL